MIKTNKEILSSIDRKIKELEERLELYQLLKRMLKNVKRYR